MGRPDHLSNHTVEDKVGKVDMIQIARERVADDAGSVIYRL
jgi:hypothetical protein